MVTAASDFPVLRALFFPKRARLILRQVSLVLSAVFLFFAASGCELHPNKNPFRYQVYPFTVQGEVCYGSLTAAVTLTMTEANRGKLIFLSPESLTDLCMEITESGTVISYGSLSYAVGDDHAFTPLVCTLVRCFSRTEQRNLRYTDTGFSDDDIEFTIDSATGYPTRVRTANVDFTIQLFTPSDVQPPSSDIPDAGKTETAA